MSTSGIGKITNIVTNDINRFSTVSTYPDLIAVPFQLVIVICVLWRYIGPSCLAGILTMLAIIPIQGIGRSRALYK